MRKAFLFDMDGVLVNSERVWHAETAVLAEKVYGPEILAKLGDTTGLSVDAEYELATRHGFVMPREEYYRLIDRHAARVYSRAEVTEQVDTAVVQLTGLGFTIDVVTSARPAWLETVLGRVPGRAAFTYLLCGGERPELRSKPHPDPYLTAMREIGVTPDRTLVLEDSNNGIRSAKAAGATVIGFRAHLLDGYQQEGADFYAENMRDVIRIAEEFAR